ncbi:MAG TPA: GNAT family N-acetyltransferase [Vicinamibacterales bacterium]
MLFASGSLVKRLENAEASLVEAFARAFESTRETADVYISRLGGGVAVYAGEGTPFNKMAGLGFEPIDELALADVEQQYASRGMPLRAEVATLADPELFKLLASRGYVLSGFENVLGLDLSASQLPIPAEGVSVRHASADEEHAWIDTVLTGFLTPDQFDGPPPTETFERELLEDVFGTASTVEGVRKYLARRDGVVAGGASMRIHDGVAQLSGASTLPAHRRRGVQTTLLAERLREAAAAGCDIAVVTTEPGSKSQQNVQRQGFALLYARAVMIRP